MEEQKVVEEIVEKEVKRESTINEEMSINLKVFDGVSRFKSIRRAMRRGLVTLWGRVAPKRPFNNRSRIKGTRPMEEWKERLYGQLRSRDTRSYGAYS